MLPTIIPLHAGLCARLIWRVCSPAYNALAACLCHIPTTAAQLTVHLPLLTGRRRRYYSHRGRIGL